MAKEKKPPMERWLRKLNRKAESTKTEYLRYFTMFLKWAELDAKGLQRLQQESLEDQDDETEDLIGEFMDWMRDEKGYSNSTQNQALKAIKSFFDANKLPFFAKDLRRRRINNGVSRVTDKGIKEIYLYAMGQGITKFRNRALYMLLKDGGIRVSDASNLNVEDYLGARSVEVRGVPFKVFSPFSTQKTGDLSYMILGPEAITEIDKYLEDRTAGPLFLSDEGKRWSPEAMTQHFLRARKYALKDRVRVSAHSFRKFFVTTLEKEIPAEWVKLLQGKKAYVYSRPQDGPELLNAYAQAYDHLRIFPHEQLDQEVRSLREDMDLIIELFGDDINLTRLREYKEMKRLEDQGVDVFVVEQQPHNKPKPK